MNAILFAPEGFVLAGAWNDIWVYTLRGLFFLSAILLMVIVLLQEGKGGGLAAALGGQGAETFGVATGGVNKVTLTLAGIFLLTGIGHALFFEPTATAALRKEARDRESTPRTVEDDLKDLEIEEGEDAEEAAPPERTPPPEKTAPPEKTETPEKE